MKHIPEYKLLMVAQNTVDYEAMKPCTTPEEAAELLEPVFAGLPREEMYVFALDSKSRITGQYLVSAGTLDQSALHPREVFGFALAANASRILLAHNHPSGDPTPSNADLQSTRRIHEAARILGIELVDHIIVGGGGRFTSLRGFFVEA